MEMSANLRLILLSDVPNNYAMNTLSSEGTNRHENQASKSKDFAMKPCNKKLFHQRPQNQMHKVHKKRKFDQCMNDDKFTTTLGLITKEKCGDKNVILKDKVEYCNNCRKDYPHLGDLDEITPNPMKQGHYHCKDLMAISNYANSTETSIKEKPTMEILKALESLVNEDFDKSSETSHFLCLKNEDMELNQPQNNLSFQNNHILKEVIPIGPRFQAEVPMWVGTTNIRHYDDDDDDLKWLGIQLWPMHDISEKNTKSIGEDRHDSCFCEFSRSIDCVKLHISEARELLKLEIGTTFSSWKFDDMGEDVSKSWTLEEQKEFEYLVKLNSLSNDTNFWKLAMKHFPSKSMKCMINYYHNVYIPRRLSIETRSSYNVVDSDNDQDENLKNKNNFSSTGRSSLSIYSRRVV